MRTHLLHAIPAVDDDTDTGRAANDDHDPRSDASTGHGRPPAAANDPPKAIDADARYWLDGYAGI